MATESICQEQSLTHEVRPQGEAQGCAESQNAGISSHISSFCSARPCASPLRGCAKICSRQIFRKEVSFKDPV